MNDLTSTIQLWQAVLGILIPAGAALVWFVRLEAQVKALQTQVLSMQGDHNSVTLKLEGLKEEMSSMARAVVRIETLLEEIRRKG